MSTRDIRIYGDPVLRRQTEPVEHFDDELRSTVEEMFEVMFAADGIGLAAPQVNISKAFLVIGMPRENEEPERLFFANPEILETRGESAFEEGCLLAGKPRARGGNPPGRNWTYLPKWGKISLETNQTFFTSQQPPGWGWG